MRYADVVRLKSVQAVLLLIALVGAFLLGRCTGPEPSKEAVVEKEQPAPVQPVEEKVPVVVEKSGAVKPQDISVEPVPPPETGVADEEGYDFTEQCRDILPDIRCWCSCLPEPPSLVPSPPKEVPEIIPEEIPEALPEVKSEVKPEVKPEVEETEEEKMPPPDIPVKVGERLPEVFLGYDDAVCAGDLVPAVRASVADLEAQAILYGVGPLSDCSGIFHRVLMGVKKRCPDHAYPPIDVYRDSRDLARWYNEQGELILIEDALQRTDLIRPGMVLFYGRAGRVFKNFTVDDLVATRAGIDHVGVVVRVQRDEDGEVSNYRLFHGHGRKGKTFASATNWHRREPTRASYPPFGNGRQQLVAAARIVRPEEQE
ncbi:MAG: hypothetical protein WGN25_00945 [Candidatus Electrothrix sp. GW3-4]|uniref:hypothetical protein n=1 Tax=Candidatus Electrothrix sp. GW3-4 TaxID=3126740 RepID=UPI0030D10EF6